MPLTSRLRAAPPYAVDGALAALVLLAASVQFLLPEEGADDPLSLPGYLFALGTAAPLVWRRRAPFAVACAVATSTGAMALYREPPPDVAYGGLVTLYTVAALGLPLQRRALLAGWLVSSSVTMAAVERAEPFEYAFHLLGFASAYALGALARMRQAYTAALEDRARRLEREREREAARAAARERARIARDMHDILAHAVSLMVVQAEAGPVVVRSDPARAEAAFDAIAAAGRDAMSQLRRILGVLGEAEADGALAPQPTVAGVKDLVEQVSGAGGMRVALRTTGAPRPLPADTEVAVYRVVQEALTNAVKHAGAATAVVRLDWTDGALAVTVTDDGRGADGGGTAPGGPYARAGHGGPDTPAAGGHGLIGIRERAAACGGTADAGPGPGGRGFRVAVRLPLEPAARAAV